MGTLEGLSQGKTSAEGQWKTPVALTYLLSIPRFQQMLVIYQVLLNSRDLKEKDW